MGITTYITIPPTEQVEQKIMKSVLKQQLFSYDFFVTELVVLLTPMTNKQNHLKQRIK
jgi:hypothetical protein